MSDLSVETLGSGTAVVLVHGSLATGAGEWEMQRPLAENGFLLIVPDRRGYAGSAGVEGEDYRRDGEDIAGLMGDGAHLVGHSYGGLGAMVAAAQRPEATLSLALLEAPAFDLGQRDPAARALVDRLRAMWNQNLPDEQWLRRFLEAVGSDPDALPPEILDAALPLVPVTRRGRPAWDADLPLDELKATSFPKLVISGGHSAGFDAICDELAERIGARRAELPGAGHEIQFTGPSCNEALLGLWSGTKT